jgi:anti-sigma factor RsiW
MAAMKCEEIRNLLHSYVDGELPAEAAIAVEAHLLDCRPCAGEYQALRTVVDTVRGAKPIYQPPAGGRRELAGMLAEHERHLRILRLVWAGVGCLLIAVAALSVYIMRQAAPYEHFVDLAADTHRRYARNALSLDYRSDDGPAVSAWLAERLPFRTSLPKYPTQPGTAKRYKLVGTRVVPFEDRSLGYVAYEMDGQPISLLIASASAVRPTGGRVYQSGALHFHFQTRQGLQLITWSDRGLSYALVSHVPALGAESCVVCHGTAAERPKFEGLVPRQPGRAP